MLDTHIGTALDAISDAGETWRNTSRQSPSWGRHGVSGVTALSLGAGMMRVGVVEISDG